MGGNNADGAQSMAVDASGNVYTTGYFNGICDFDPGVGIFTLSAVGVQDIFVSKLDASGNFVWAKSMGGAAPEEAHGIAVTQNGYVFITGYFSGTCDFNPGAGVYTLSPTGGDDIFICKLDPSGNFVWAKNIGGTGSCGGQAITVDNFGNSYVTGLYSGTADFDPGPGTYTLTANGSSDIFVCYFTTAGVFSWAKGMGSAANNSQGNSISLDASGNVFTTGSFAGTVDFDPGAGTFTLASAGFDDIFVSKLTSAGAFAWAGNMGGTGTDNGQSIFVDIFGNIFLTGSFNGTADFDPAPTTYTLSSGGFADVFICRLDPSGALGMAVSFKGQANGNDSGQSLCVDATGNIMVTGFFQSPVDFDPGVGSFTMAPVGAADAFVCKVDGNGTFVWAISMGGTGDDYALTSAIDVAGNMYAAGNYSGTADFDPTVGTSSLTSSGASDIFAMKFSNIVIPASLSQYSIPSTLYSLYPNPCRGEFLIDCKTPSTGSGAAELQLYNDLGQLILKQKIIEGLNKIYVGNNTPGIYHYLISNNNSVIGKGNLAVE